MFKTPIWRQFQVKKSIPTEYLARIMEDYAYNMKKENVEDDIESNPYGIARHKCGKISTVNYLL